MFYDINENITFYVSRAKFQHQQVLSAYRRASFGKQQVQSQTPSRNRFDQITHRAAQNNDYNSPEKQATFAFIERN